MDRVVFYFVVVAHHLLAVGLVVAPIACIILQPWYVALIACTFVVRTITSRDRCILTDMEAKYREKLGLAPLKNGFVGHYYVFWK